MADSLKFKTPKGKIVYGGGGIIPDVFVPIGTVEEERVESLDSRGYFSDFIFRFLERDRTRFANFPKVEFINDYKVDDIIFERFIDYALGSNIKMDFYGQDEKIKRFLKANIAEQMYSPNLAAEIKSTEDKMLQKILELNQEKIEIDSEHIIEANN